LEWLFPKQLPSIFRLDVISLIRKYIISKKTMIIFSGWVIFLIRKMAKIEKISKETLLSTLRVGERILNPLVIRRLVESGKDTC